MTSDEASIVLLREAIDKLKEAAQETTMDSFRHSMNGMAGRLESMETSFVSVMSNMAGYNPGKKGE